MQLGWPTSTFHVATSLCTLQFAEIPFFRHPKATFPFSTFTRAGVAERDLHSISSFYDCFRISWKLVCLVLIRERVLEQWTIPFCECMLAVQAFHAPKEFYEHTGIHFCCAAVWKVLLIFSHLCLFRTKLQSLFLFFALLPLLLGLEIQVSMF